MSSSIDGSAALLDSLVDVTSALVQTLQQAASQPSSSAAVSAMQCLANLTRTQRGVKAALQADLPHTITDIVKQVGADKDIHIQAPSAA